MGLHVYCTVDSITVSSSSILEILPAYTCFSSGILCIYLFCLELYHNHVCLPAICCENHQDHLAQLPKKDNSEF